MSVSQAQVIEKDHGWNDMMEAVREMGAKGETYAKVGVFADDKIGGMHKKDPDTGLAENLTVAEIAVVQEFGTQDGHIPSRSFLRSTFDKLVPKLQEMAEKLLGQVVFKNMPRKKALDIMGLFLSSETKKAITSGPEIPPTNAPYTKWKKARKGMSSGPIRRIKKEFGKEAVLLASYGAVRTLIDTATLVRAIAWAVVEGGKQDPAGHP